MSENAEKNIASVTVNDDMIPDFDITIGQTEITKDRVIATVRALLMVATSVCTMLGFSFDVDRVEQIALVVLMIASMAWGYWQNNNWTKTAVVAQQVQNGLKNKTSETDAAE